MFGVSAATLVILALATIMIGGVSERDQEVAPRACARAEASVEAPATNDTRPARKPAESAACERHAAVR
jgi:hypothetical protein